MESLYIYSFVLRTDGIVFLLSHIKCYALFPRKKNCNDKIMIYVLQHSLGGWERCSLFWQVILVGWLVVFFCHKIQNSKILSSRKTTTKTQTNQTKTNKQITHPPQHLQNKAKQPKPTESHSCLHFNCNRILQDYILQDASYN